MVLTITSGYGPRRIVVQGKARSWPHRGIDVRSPEGADVEPLFDGLVVAVASGRRPGAGIGAWDNGHPPLASTVSGNGVIVKRDAGGYYVEVHLDPAVEVGDRVRAGVGSLGRTDLSGQITGAHRHIELWTALDPETHYDPTAAVLAAAAGPKGTQPAPEEDDDMTPEQVQTEVRLALYHLINEAEARANPTARAFRDDLDNIIRNACRVAIAEMFAQAADRSTPTGRALHDDIDTINKE